MGPWSSGYDATLTILMRKVEIRGSSPRGPTIFFLGRSAKDFISVKPNNNNRRRQTRQLVLYQIGIQQRWRDVKRIDLVWHTGLKDRACNFDLILEFTMKFLNLLVQGIEPLQGEVIFSEHGLKLPPDLPER